jgi:N-acetylmuramidase
MNITELQYAIGTTADGAWGAASRAALVAALTNKNAPAATADDIARIAGRLGASPAQLRAVAAVESSGGGFDMQGRPKILFERHLFHRQTGGKFSPAPYSQASGGGYSESSWGKLATACGKDPGAAIGACSWGKFQVLGLHWSKLAYASPWELAHSLVTGEAAHYDLFARYIETFGLRDALRKVSADPADCRAFAQGYNGPAYRKFSYDTRIAKGMA